MSAILEPETGTWWERRGDGGAPSSDVAVTARDRGYDDRDTYSGTVDGAQASAEYHALRGQDDDLAPTRAEIAAEEAQERARAGYRGGWRR